MIRKLCSSVSRFIICPKSTKSIFFSCPFRQSFRYSSTLSHSSLKMADTQTPDNSTTPNLPSISSITRPELLRALEFHMGSCFSVDPIVPSPNQLIIVISGPSGVGKDAVINELREVREGLHFVVTATSRQIRPGEIDGRDYFFVSRYRFLSMVENDEILEYALVCGEYKGIFKKQIQEFMVEGQDIVLRVDIQGAQTLRRILGNSAVFIFILAESELSMVERLIDRRTESQEELLVRVATSREEIGHLKNFDYIVVNAKEKLEDAVNRVESIIDAEKSKVSSKKCPDLMSFFH